MFCTQDQLLLFDICIRFLWTFSHFHSSWWSIHAEIFQVARCHVHWWMKMIKVTSIHHCPKPAHYLSSWCIRIKEMRGWLIWIGIAHGKRKWTSGHFHGRMLAFFSSNCKYKMMASTFYISTRSRDRTCGQIC
jgi:hypothetical protein